MFSRLTSVLDSPLETCFLVFSGWLTQVHTNLVLALIIISCDLVGSPMTFLMRHELSYLITTPALFPSLFPAVNHECNAVTPAGLIQASVSVEKCAALQSRVTFSLLISSFPCLTRL